MARYVEEELPAVLGAFPELDRSREAISGHSMGGHGALTIALRNPSRFRSVSAFAPICAPSEVPWGQKAFRGYLGEDRSTWARYDACALLAEAPSAPPLRIDQGAADAFLETQLRPELLLKAAAQGGHALDYHLHDGYDHSYFFIASFIDAHLAFHAEHLVRA